jgi:hypothetical protein
MLSTRFLTITFLAAAFNLEGEAFFVGAADFLGGGEDEGEGVETFLEADDGLDFLAEAGLDFLAEAGLDFLAEAGLAFFAEGVDFFAGVFFFAD